MAITFDGLRILEAAAVIRRVVDLARDRISVGRSTPTLRVYAHAMRRDAGDLERPLSARQRR